MPLPLPQPAYLTDENYNWNGDNFASVLITEDLTVGGTQRVLRWDVLDVYDNPMVNGLIMGYAERGTPARAEAVAVSGFTPGEAYHSLNYGGALNVGLNAGLKNGVVYTAVAYINAVEYPISILGVSTDTIADIITKVNATIVPNGGTLSIYNNDLELRSNVAGSGQVVEMFDDNLFKSIIGFVQFEDPRVGVTVIGDVFDLNFKFHDQTFAEALIGKLKNTPNTTTRQARTSIDIYFNHGTKAWLKTYDNSAII